MKILRQLRANSQGVALIEFAIVFPILLLLFVGSIETARYLL
ncbi:TadE/TadG family type IV pilus assembly protein, partial [Pseudoalteromonas distincta]